MLHATGVCYTAQVHVLVIWYRHSVSPKRVSRYRVPSCLSLSLKVRVGCEADRGGIQESLQLKFYTSFFLEKSAQKFMWMAKKHF